MKRREPARMWSLIAATGLAAGCTANGPRTASATSACTPVNGSLEPATGEARQVDALLQRYSQYGFSGTVLVRRDSRPVLSKGYGLASVEERTPNTPGTLFDVASLAKTFTAAAILDLEARGRLSTQDPLWKYFPGLPAEKRSITLHHLLTHTSGYPLDMSDMGVKPDHSTEEILAAAAAAKLLRAPGAEYSYSNVGYGLLAQVIEKVSGRSWQAYARERLLRRAGLKNTYLFGETLPKGTRLARGYLGPSEEEAVVQPPTAQSRSPLLWGKHPLGAVGVLTTVGDLDRWWCALNGPKLLPPVQRAKLFAPQAANQGYGWNITHSDGRVTRIHRGGLRGSYQSLIAYYPDRRDLIVYSINKNVNVIWANLVWRNIERILRNEPVALPPALAPVDDPTLARREGVYALRTGGRLHFRKAGPALFFGAEGQDALDRLEDESQSRPEAREALHDAALRLLRALNAGDRQGADLAARTSAAKLAEVEEQWKRWVRTIGPLREIELLGSTRGAQNHLRTFVRLRGSNGTLVVRLLWDQSKSALLAWGDDIPLPAYTRLWAQADADFVSYDLATGRTRFFRFGGDRVTVASEDGSVILEGVRLP